MEPSVILQEGLAIPSRVLGHLDEFRAWTLSDEFPCIGRIDYLQGNVEVDMSPEDLMRHGVVKVKLSAYILGVVEGSDLGLVFSDSTRYVHSAVGLSCEPDIVFLSWAGVEAGRARYVESSPGKIMEIEGSATLVVEIVSDSSVDKDLKRLPRLYAQAGVEELWIVDARSNTLRFEIRHPYQGEWRPAEEHEGFQRSGVLRRELRLRREPSRRPGTWRYLVDEKST
ncbi:MAG: Uma2 family endonuclease [Candidatus Xenobia bacterium]